MSSDPTSRDDPGWGVVWKTMLKSVVLGPFGWFGSRKGRRPADGLTAIRFLFAALLEAGILVAFVSWFIFEEWGSPSDSTVLIALPTGFLSVVGALIARNRSLDAETEEALVRSFRTNFFVGFVLCEFPYLGTFVLSFVSDTRLPVFVGLPFYVVAMTLVAPGRTYLRKTQQDIMASGSTLDLTDVLMKSPPPAARDGTIGR